MIRWAIVYGYAAIIKFGVPWFLVFKRRRLWEVKDGHES
jgi:hypothetical protein